MNQIFNSSKIVYPIMFIE